MRGGVYDATENAVYERPPDALCVSGMHGATGQKSPQWGGKILLRCGVRTPSARVSQACLMRFIVVTARRPKGNACTMMCEAVSDYYVRDLSTRLAYCTVACYAQHLYESMVAVGGTDVSMEFPYTRRPKVLSPPVLLLQGPLATGGNLA